jgi:hypothetical protein
MFLVFPKQHLAWLVGAQASMTKTLTCRASVPTPLAVGAPPKRERGLNSLSAPVFDSFGRVAAALAVSARHFG